MAVEAVFVLASFTVPEQIGVNPQSVLWLLPLLAAISIVYKTTKLRKITVANFVKEAAILFSSIAVFIVIAALALYALSWLITE